VFQLESHHRHGRPLIRQLENQARCGLIRQLVRLVPFRVSYRRLLLAPRQSAEVPVFNASPRTREKEPEKLPQIENLEKLLPRSKGFLGLRVCAFMQYRHHELFERRCTYHGFTPSDMKRQPTRVV